MPKLRIRGIALDMYGTVVNVGAVGDACREVASDPAAFITQWRTKQLEYSFLRSLMGKYQDFWKVSEQALDFGIKRFSLTVSPGQRRQLMEAWLRPTPYPARAVCARRSRRRSNESW